MNCFTEGSFRARYVVNLILKGNFRAFIHNECIAPAFDHAAALQAYSGKCAGGLATAY